MIINLFLTIKEIGVMLNELRKYNEIFELVYNSNISHKNILDLLIREETELKKENMGLYDLLLLTKNIDEVREVIKKYDKEYKNWLLKKILEEILMEETEQIYDLLYKLIITFGDSILTDDLKYVYSCLDDVPLEKNKNNWNLEKYKLKRRKILLVKNKMKEEVKKINYNVKQYNI